MKLSRTIPKTEAEKFHEKFSGKSYKSKANILGELISVETKDSEIIKYLKKIGLTQLKN
jgi:hypothetical protein